MSIYEEIKNYRELAKAKREDAAEYMSYNPVPTKFDCANAEECIKFAEEYEQLANWLQELKEYKEKQLMSPTEQMRHTWYEAGRADERKRILTIINAMN